MNQKLYDHHNVTKNHLTWNMNDKATTVTSYVSSSYVSTGCVSILGRVRINRRLLLFDGYNKTIT